MVVPFAPGGSTDAVARLVSPGLSQRLGQPVVVENRSGGAGAIGTDAVAKARPDGSTWLLTFDSHAVLPALVPRLPFNLTRDLDPVMLIGGAPYVIATRSDKPFRTIADLVAAARARPDAVLLRLGRQRHARAPDDGAAAVAHRPSMPPASALPRRRPSR